MTTEIITALIGTSGVFVTAILGYCAKRGESRRRARAEDALASVKATLDYGSFLSTFHDLDHEVDRLISETSIDRVLILNAWNGLEDPKWTTAVYQHHAPGQSGRSYIAVRLDPDYIQRLRTIKAGGRMWFKTEDLPPALVRQIYESEGVRSSVWYHLDSREIPNGKNGPTSCCYVSFSSQTGEIPPEDETRCTLIADRMAQHVRMFYEN